MIVRGILVVAAATVHAACGWTPASPQRAGQFRFAVFGDGPYNSREARRFGQLVDALNERDVAFVIHVGDILWYPCSDGALRDRLARINDIRHPVIYTPGDNEWADCHEPIAGSYDPLDRLASLRRIFFPLPGTSLGRQTISLESQATDSAFGEFVENARWTHADILFATVHVVGSGNATEPFRGRRRPQDDEVARRTAAVEEWIRGTFTAAGRRNAKAVVLAFHAEMFLDPPDSPFTPILTALAIEAARFGKPVLLVHGDDHELKFDRPLIHPATGRRVENVQRLETFGSPDIGWVDVVVDTTSERLFHIEPNMTPRWMFW